MNGLGLLQGSRRWALAFGLGGGLCLVGGCGDPEAGSMPQLKKSKKDSLGADNGKVDPAKKTSSKGGRGPR